MSFVRQCLFEALVFSYWTVPARGPKASLQSHVLLGENPGPRENTIEIAPFPMSIWSFTTKLEKLACIKHMTIPKKRTNRTYIICMDIASQ